MFFFNKSTARCGHQTKLKGKVSAFGETVIMKMLKRDGKPEFCLDCLGKMAIQCAWCGKPIFIGDPITLYSPGDEKYRFPAHAVIYNKEKRQAVGCLRRECADTGMDRAGFWITPGKVKRVATAYEILMANPKKESLKISDIGNPAEALPISE